MERVIFMVKSSHRLGTGQLEGQDLVTGLVTVQTVTSHGYLHQVVTILEVLGGSMEEIAGRGQFIVHFGGRLE